MVGKQLLNTGAEIVKDVIDGQNFGDATRENFKEGGLALLNNISSKLRDKPRARRAPPKKRRRLHPSAGLLANVRVEV